MYINAITFHTCLETSCLAKTIGETYIFFKNILMFNYKMKQIKGVVKKVKSLKTPIFSTSH